MNWEPWTGCYKISDGCTNCYFYGPHAKRHGQNTIMKTERFDWPIQTNKKESTGSREIKHCQPALRQIFSFRKRMNGGRTSGL